MSPVRHAARIGLLMAAAALFLGALAARTEIIYADGLRYIEQAQSIAQGTWKQTVMGTEDHPAYPLAIAAVHRVRGGTEPADWQASAQLAAVIAGTLLVLPLYLFGLELHGPRAAWLACVLTFLVPLTGHVLADALSEGTFLLFWISGCWAALRFLRAGSTVWLAAAIALGGLAYLVRPEGLLLPVALAGLIVTSLVIPSLRLEGAAAWRAWAILVVGPLVFIGPYAVARGGLGTKPAVGRLLGLRPASAAMAVERERPLDPDQSTLRTVGLACRGAAMAVAGAVPPPLLVLALLGLPHALRNTSRRRGQAFVGLVGVGWLLAMVRLYATSGYCTPRHALILALPLLALAASGTCVLLDRLSTRLVATFPRVNLDKARGGLLVLGLAAFLLLWGRDLSDPINRSFQGYRQAGDWIAAHTPADAKVLDLKGWSLFYGHRGGYSFANHPAALGDREIGYVVASDSLLIGPWSYCDVVRKIVAGRPPIRSFPATRQKGVAQVHVFELRPGTAGAPASVQRPLVR